MDSPKERKVKKSKKKDKNKTKRIKKDKKSKKDTKPKILSSGSVKILKNKQIINKLRQNKFGSKETETEALTKTNKAEKKEGDPKKEESSESQDNSFVKRMLGFTSFGSTKGKNHSKTSVEGIYKASVHHRKYRQYMNRKGGYNRPLENT